MAALVPSRFNLKTLHEEIGLYDRKIAHTLKFETFATEEARNTAAAKLTAKRALLVRSAQQMASDGIEFLPSELPLSLQQPVAAAEIEPEASPAVTA